MAPRQSLALMGRFVLGLRPLLVKGFGAEKKHWNEESRRMRLLTAKGVEDEDDRTRRIGEEIKLCE